VTQAPAVHSHRFASPTFAPQKNDTITIRSILHEQNWIARFYKWNLKYFIIPNRIEFGLDIFLELI